MHACFRFLIHAVCIYRFLSSTSRKEHPRKPRGSWSGSRDFHGRKFTVLKNRRAPGQLLLPNQFQKFEFPAFFIAQGLSRSYSKLSPTKIPATRLTAPGSPSMRKEAVSCNSHFRHTVVCIFIPIYVKTRAACHNPESFAAEFNQSSHAP